MGEKSKIMLGALIPGVIMATIAILTECFPDFWLYKIVFVVLAYCIALLLTFMVDYLWNGYGKAHFDLWHIGKIRGLWEKKGLMNQIKKNFYSSDSVKIKVTRGYELLQSSKSFGFNEIFEDLKDGRGKNHNSQVVVKFLLILPCFKEEHVRDRYERHTNLTEKEFLETWYEFLKKVRTFNTDHLSVNVRFYFDSHARWRFYIFSKPNKKNTTVLLSDYDKNAPGKTRSMYKIMKGERNIGDFMSNYFDDLWNNALTPKDLVVYIQQEKCKTNFCQHCTQDLGTTCQHCKDIECKYSEMCKELVSEYSSKLLSFNAGGKL